VCDKYGQNLISDSPVYFLKHHVLSSSSLSDFCSVLPAHGMYAQAQYGYYLFIFGHFRLSSVNCDTKIRYYDKRPIKTHCLNEIDQSQRNINTAASHSGSSPFWICWYTERNGIYFWILQLKWPPNKWIYRWEYYILITWCLWPWITIIVIVIGEKIA